MAVIKQERKCSNWYSPSRGTTSLPTTTDVTNCFVYSAAGKLCEERQRQREREREEMETIDNQSLSYKLTAATQGIGAFTERIPQQPSWR